MQAPKLLSGMKQAHTLTLSAIEMPIMAPINICAAETGNLILVARTMVANVQNWALKALEGERNANRPPKHRTSFHPQTL